MDYRQTGRLYRGGAMAAAFAVLAAAPAVFAQAAAGPKIVLHGGSYLGVGLAEVDSQRASELKLKEERGVEITSVAADSPAERAGIRKGDVVLDYNGTSVLGIEQFARLVRETPAGRSVKLTISRSGSVQTLSATIEEYKGGKVFSRSWTGPEINVPEIWIPDIPRAFTSWRSSMLGIEGEGLDGQLADYFGVKEGVLIRSVVKDTPAERAGLKAGDVIVKADGKTVSSPRELSSEIRSFRSKQTFSITVMRDKREVTVNVTLEGERSSVPKPARRVTQREQF
jgi:serine protease Do